ncbi:MAG: nitrile hydratase subunit alpha [Acidimicrobiales bacterium]
MSDHDDHHDDHHRENHDPRSPKLRAEALEDLLVEKGLLDRAKVDATIEKFETDVGPMIGAKLVARAWTDDDFRDQLIADADATIAAAGITGPEIEHLEVKANEPGVHNVVVCTLCSCYPWAVLGLPPNWFKSPEYRSRVVKEPRRVLSEMGLELDDDTLVRVWDSSSETRFLVLPERPSGTEGLSLEELAALVSRDSMIGVAKAYTP